MWLLPLSGWFGLLAGGGGVLPLCVGRRACQVHVSVAVAGLVLRRVASTGRQMAGCGPISGCGGCWDADGGWPVRVVGGEASLGENSLWPSLVLATVISAGVAIVPESFIEELCSYLSPRPCPGGKPQI